MSLPLYLVKKKMCILYKKLVLKNWIYDIMFVVLLFCTAKYPLTSTNAHTDLLWSWRCRNLTQNT